MSLLLEQLLGLEEGQTPFYRGNLWIWVSLDVGLHASKLYVASSQSPSPKILSQKANMNSV